MLVWDIEGTGTPNQLINSANSFETKPPSCRSIDNSKFSNQSAVFHKVRKDANLGDLVLAVGYGMDSDQVVHNPRNQPCDSSTCDLAVADKQISTPLNLLCTSKAWHNANYLACSALNTPDLNRISTALSGSSGGSGDAFYGIDENPKDAVQAAANLALDDWDQLGKQRQLQTKLYNRGDVSGLTPTWTGSTSLLHRSPAVVASAIATVKGFEHTADVVCSLPKMQRQARFSKVVEPKAWAKSTVHSNTPDFLASDEVWRFDNDFQTSSIMQARSRRWMRIVEGRDIMPNHSLDLGEHQKTHLTKQVDLRRRTKTRELLERLHQLVRPGDAVEGSDEKSVSISMNAVLQRAVQAIERLPCRDSCMPESWCRGCGVCRQCEAALVERRCAIPPPVPFTSSCQYSPCSDIQVDGSEWDDLGSYVADLVPALSLMLVPDSNGEDSGQLCEAVITAKRRLQKSFRHYRVQYATTACKVVIGLERKEIVGRLLSDLIHPDDLPDLLETLCATSTAVSTLRNQPSKDAYDALEEKNNPPAAKRRKPPWSAAQATALHDSPPLAHCVRGGQADQEGSRVAWTARWRKESPAHGPSTHRSADELGQQPKGDKVPFAIDSQASVAGTGCEYRQHAGWAMRVGPAGAWLLSVNVQPGEAAPVRSLGLPFVS